MRQPTSIEAQFAWHRAALAGQAPSLHEEPCCGWYKIRLVRGGPFAPARIWLEQEVCAQTGELLADEKFRCEIAFRAADAEEKWLHLCKNPISQKDYNYMQRVMQWAETNAPHEPSVNLYKPVDWNAVPVPTFNKEKSHGR